MHYTVNKHAIRVRCMAGCGAVVDFSRKSGKPQRSPRRAALCPKCGWEHWKPTLKCEEKLVFGK
jgi:hypothetical protein